MPTDPRDTPRLEIAGHAAASDGDRSPRVRVVTEHRSLYIDMVAPLVDRLDAELIELSDREPPAIPSKARIVASLLRPRLLSLRGRWTTSDHVVVVGWLVLPLLTMMKARWVARPRTLLALGTFVQSPSVARLFAAFVRGVGWPGLAFVTHSRTEAEAKLRQMRLDPGAVLDVLWRNAPGGQPDSDRITDGGYLFSGGYANRDYDLLVRAASETGVPLKIVASRLNDIRAPLPPNVELLTDLPEDRFELLLAGARAVVLPIRNSGDGCGLSVLTRSMRNAKPVIITRTQPIAAYLGESYDGYFDPASLPSLVEAMRRCSADTDWRERLRAQVATAHRRVAMLGRPGDDLVDYLVRRDPALHSLPPCRSEAEAVPERDEGTLRPQFEAVTPA